MRVGVSTSLEKAQKINLEPNRYGSFSEIGAGQEVVRFFFQASGSAGTVIKSISAYDMKISDFIYGKCLRYVCRDRLNKMLDYESNLTMKRLSEKEGKNKSFFTYANTVSAQNYKNTNYCHGWMGVDFQNTPKENFNRIIIHFNLKDKTNLDQQEAVGILGVNLLDAAFNYTNGLEGFLSKLFDNLNLRRVEVDNIDFSGKFFENIDNRFASLYLVKMGLSHATMFDYKGNMLLPSEKFYKKNIILERGSFYPLTNLHLDILYSTMQKYREAYCGDNILPIMEISMNNLFKSSDNNRNLDLFLKISDMLCCAGANVLITDYAEYYRLTQYLLKNTQQDIIIALGANIVESIFNEKYYVNLSGGLLESLGKMFKRRVKLFVYPYKNLKTGEIKTVNNLDIDKKILNILEYFKKQEYIIQLDNYSEDSLGYNSSYVMNLLNRQQDGWQNYVPSILVKEMKKDSFILNRNDDNKKIN